MVMIYAGMPSVTLINEPILKEKEIKRTKNFKKLVHSQQVMDGWKKCYGVCFTGICYEKLLAYPSVIRVFFFKKTDIITSEILSPEQVDNIDEMGLNFKLLSKKCLLANFIPRI